MRESVTFHADFYRREAVESAAEKHLRRARIDIEEAESHVIARLESVDAEAPDARRIVDEFCTEALSITVKQLRDLGASAGAPREVPASDTPPWALLAPFAEGAALGFGWVLESLTPIRSGAAGLALRHEQHGVARVAIRRNGGAPLGVAHTSHLDFMLMNGGSGTTQTEGSISQALMAMAAVLREHESGLREETFGALRPHAEGAAPQTSGAANGRSRSVLTPVEPQADLEARTVTADFIDDGISRLSFYDAVLSFADRCHVFLSRPDPGRVRVRLTPKDGDDADVLSAVARQLGESLQQLVQKAVGGPASPRAGLPPLAPRRVNLATLLAELAAADPETLGVGFQPERGPGHQNLRVLNIRGTGACNSECAFCIEKFNPTHRPMPTTDATRQMILDSAGRFDMLFFASGEPTIHPKLFEHVELAKQVGFTSFGMSSHFRTFADPHFTLKTLQAGFEYFDISLHAADRESQLAVNPIGDGGESLLEALKGLAVLFRLADALGIRVSVTQKIVVSRLNVTRLLPIFRATYDRGVRHFIVQPVRTLGLAPELQAKLAIAEEGILPHLNELLRATEGMGATIKPYGFSRSRLVTGAHVETEQNRVKNYYGRRFPHEKRSLPTATDERPTDGRHWIQVHDWPSGQFSFASDGKAPILDDALERGMDLSFGCRMGSCGMCSARLLDGRVDQSTQIFLTEDQMQQGFVLLCQARPLTDVVVRVCTNEEIDQL
jgi:ferredoxin